MASGQSRPNAARAAIEPPATASLAEAAHRQLQEAMLTNDGRLELSRKSTAHQVARVRRRDAQGQSDQHSRHKQQQATAGASTISESPPLPVETPAVASRQQRDVVVKLARSRWPEPRSTIQQQSGSASEPRTTRTSNAREISGIPRSLRRVESSEPLIHTDHLNTSSPVLTVITPPHQQQQQVDSRIRSISPPDHQLAGSAFSASRLGVLAASYANRQQIQAPRRNSPPTTTATMTDDNSSEQPPEYPEILQRQQSESPIMRPNTDDSITAAMVTIPRLVLLNLEVSSSSATLSWNLQLVSPSSQQQQQRRQQRSNAPPIALSGEPDGLVARAEPASAVRGEQQSPTTTTSEPTSPNSTDERGGRNKASLLRLEHLDGSGGVASGTVPHWLRVAEMQQQLPQIGTVRRSAEEPVIVDSAERAVNASGARSVAKRDTMMSQSPSDGFQDGESPMDEDGQEGDSDNTPSEAPLLPAAASADQRDGSFSMETTSGADQMSDPLSATSPASAGGDYSSPTLFTRRKARIPTSTSTTSSTTAAPSINADPSELEGGFGGGNIQLGRLQPLQASRNRRPPMRITSDATRSPSTSSTTSTTTLISDSTTLSPRTTTETPVVQSRTRSAASATSTLPPETTAPSSTSTAATTSSTTSTTTRSPRTSKRPTRKGARRRPSTTKRPADVEGGADGGADEQTTSTGQDIAHELDGWQLPEAARVQTSRSSQKMAAEPASEVGAPVFALNRLSTASTTTSTEPPLRSATSEVPTTPTPTAPSSTRTPSERSRPTTTTLEPASETSLPPTTKAAASALSSKPVAPGVGNGAVRPEVRPATGGGSSRDLFETKTPSMIAASPETTTDRTPDATKSPQATAPPTKAPLQEPPTTIVRGTNDESSQLDDQRLSSLVGTEQPSSKPSVKLIEQPIAGKPVKLGEQTEPFSTTDREQDKRTPISIAKDEAPTAPPAARSAAAEAAAAAAEAVLAATTVAASASRPDRDNLGGQAPALLANSSQWLVRLRRFGSNEVDVVKVVVNNLRQLLASNQVQPQQGQQLDLRRISFRNLEPSSAYEICVESASANQQISDKFHIMDANHFLKCQDSTEVQLGVPSVASETNSSSPAADGNSDERLPVALPLSTPTTSGQRRHEEREHDHVHNAKMKSLCKEFFTLPLESSERANWGLSALAPPLAPAANSSQISSSQLKAQTSTGSSPGNQSSIQQQARKPKALQNNALTSRIELLEINDFHLPGSHRSWNIFELAVPQRQNGNNWNQLSPAFGAASARGLTQVASDSTYSSSRTQPTLTGNWSSTVDESASGANISSNGGNQQHASASATESYLISSIMPIVGCVFALIFIVTLANILLNTISCRSSTLARRRRLARHRRRSIGANSGTGILSGRTMAGGLVGLNAGAGSHKQHTLGSLYSDSDHSGGGDSSGQSRIIVIGKNSDPFALTSAYFEVAHDPLLAAASATGGGLSGCSSAASSRASRLNANELGSFDPTKTTTGSTNGSINDGAGSGNQRYTSSAYLLSGAGRFPLGPSFEGDERHNADMVGLARKNYDNFINNIYNSDPDPRGDLVSDRMQELQFESPSQRRSVHRKIHHQHINHLSDHKHSYGYGRNHLESKDEKQQANHYQSSETVGGANRQMSHSQAQSKDSSANGNQANRKRQRIRFDKINPIYNMEGLQCSLTGTNTSTRSVEKHRALTSNRLKSYPSAAGSGAGGLISFGHTNPALVAEENDELEVAGQKQQSNSLSSGCQQDDDLDEQCPYCRAELERSAQPGKSQDANQANSNADCDNDDFGAGENCDESLHFTCCLDRQQQRIHTQQQQLERVMNKNGSLVPQPFINPPEEIMFGDSQPESTATEEAPPTTTNGARSPQTIPKRPATRLSMTMPATTSNQLPAPPPPPPNFKTIPSSASSGGNGDFKASANVGASSNGSNKADASVMDKTDFNQRRNELASKLRLAGMGNPN